MLSLTHWRTDYIILLYQRSGFKPIQKFAAVVLDKEHGICWCKELALSQLRIPQADAISRTDICMIYDHSHSPIDHIRTLLAVSTVPSLLMCCALSEGRRSENGLFTVYGFPKQS
jgi:hypothetical protein